MSKKGWEVRKVDSLSCMVMPTFEETKLVVHGVTTKEVGNFAGDDLAKELRKKFITLGINPEKMIFLSQVHGDEIYVVGESRINQNPILQTDGLITNIPLICLVIKVADCVPIFILDTKNKAIGLVHAGWRGTIKCIAQKAILKMSTSYGSLPKDILVGFGPSIGICCYKIGDAVSNQFGEHLIKNGYLDLQKVNKLQLLDLGILEENIILSQYCTYDNNDLFFSHRRGEKGRMLAFLQLTQVHTSKK